MLIHKMSTVIYSKKTNAELIALTNDVIANKALYDARVVAIDATLNEFQTNYNAHLANFDSEKLYRDGQKADIDAAISDVDAKIDTEKAALQLVASIDALAASTSGDAGALSSRVTELESKVGSDLTATINTALEDGVVQATLDGFLAKDTELASAVAGAVADRVNVDNAIKAKFDALVDTLFEGLTFVGVTANDLKFNPSS